MRTIILIAAFLLAMPASAQNDTLFQSIFNKIEHDLDFDKQLVIIKIVDAAFASNRSIIEGPVAATEKLHGNYYRITFFKHVKGDKLTKAIIHELVHVAQMQAGRLIVERKCIIFDGHTYTKETPYALRAYETESVQFSEALFIKYF